MKNKVAVLLSCLLLFAVSSRAEEIVIDNRDAAPTGARNWWISSAPNGYRGESLYSNHSSRFSWRMPIGYPGEYDVYAWWTYHPNRSTSVPYYIELNDEQETARVVVNQRDPELAGQWNFLGRFLIAPRYMEIYISVSSENGQASADAVRLVRVEPKEWPYTRCVCDEWYGRAIDKYLGYGGSLNPSGVEGGASEASCSDPSGPLDATARYTTVVNSSTGETITLFLQAYGTPSSGGYYGCAARVTSSILGDVYKQDQGLDPAYFSPCRVSVHNFCKDDVTP